MPDNALARGNSSESYVHTTETGAQHVGKGGPKRPAVSACELEKWSGEKAIKSEWEGAVDEVQSLLDEARKIRERSGIKNLLNRTNSPGDSMWTQ